MSELRIKKTKKKKEKKRSMGLSQGGPQVPSYADLDWAQYDYTSSKQTQINSPLSPSKEINVSFVNK